jgi:hypothetical protein
MLVWVWGEVFAHTRHVGLYILSVGACVGPCRITIIFALYFILNNRVFWIFVCYNYLGAGL